LFAYDSFGTINNNSNWRSGSSGMWMWKMVDGNGEMGKRGRVCVCVSVCACAACKLMGQPKGCVPFRYVRCVCGAAKYATL